MSQKDPETTENEPVEVSVKWLKITWPAPTLGSQPRRLEGENQNSARLRVMGIFDFLLEYRVKSKIFLETKNFVPLGNFLILSLNIAIISKIISKGSVWAGPEVESIMGKSEFR